MGTEKRADVCVTVLTARARPGAHPGANVCSHARGYAMRPLLEIGPEGEIYSDGEVYFDPELEDVDGPLADSAP